MTEQAGGLTAQPDSLARSMHVVGWTFGIVFLLAGLAWLGQETRIGWAAQLASGTIVEVRARESAEGPEFYPVVGFAAPDGRVIRFEGVSTSRPRSRGHRSRCFTTPPNPGTRASIVSFNDGCLGRCLRRWASSSWRRCPLGEVRALGAPPSCSWPSGRWRLGPRP
jgi:hypothetical protein